MDLQRLPRDYEVTPEVFRQLFELRLGRLFQQANEVFNTLGEMHSYSIANLINLGLQKGIVSEIIEALEKWRELFTQAPDPITAHVDTRHFFDWMYGRFFYSQGDRIDGIVAFEIITSGSGIECSYPSED